MLIFFRCTKVFGQIFQCVPSVPILYYTSATLAGARLLENTSSEKNNLKNSTYKKFSFLSLFTFQAQIFILRRENNITIKATALSKKILSLSLWNVSCLIHVFFCIKRSLGFLNFFLCNSLGTYISGTVWKHIWVWHYIIITI